MTITVRDSALKLSIIIGHHHMERHSFPAEDFIYISFKTKISKD